MVHTYFYPVLQLQFFERFHHVVHRTEIFPELQFSFNPEASKTQKCCFKTRKQN